MLFMILQPWDCIALSQNPEIACHGISRLHKHSLQFQHDISMQSWDCLKEVLNLEIMLKFNLLLLWLKVNGTLGCHSIVFGLSSELPSVVMVWCSSYFLYAKISHFLPIATALLVAGLTLTLWMPGQTLFASTSSYSGLVQRLPADCIMQVAIV